MLFDFRLLAVMESIFVLHSLMAGGAFKPLVRTGSNFETSYTTSTSSFRIRIFSGVAASRLAVVESSV